MSQPLDAASAGEDGASRRFSLVVLAIVLAGLATSVTMAILVDPFHVFGTGRVPSLMTGERDEKPAAFLARPLAPQALVLGSSRVMKLEPACVTELTGLPAYNFGVSDGGVDDLAAILGFAQARGHAAIRAVIVGLDVESFAGNQADARLLSSRELHSYVGGTHRRSWSDVTQALFGWQGLRYALPSLYYAASPASKPKLKIRYEADGLVSYDEWEREFQTGDRALRSELDRNVHRFATVFAYRDFLRLDRDRLVQLRAVFEREHALGVSVLVFIPPVHRALVAARADGPIAARTAELDQELRALARDGLITYLPMRAAADYGGDPDGYYDGIHLTEHNATRLLLALFGRAHGCGQ